jgi:hypothetical protein
MKSYVNWIEMHVDELGNPPAADNKKFTNTDHCTRTNDYKYR